MVAAVATKMSASLLLTFQSRYSPGRLSSFHPVYTSTAASAAVGMRASGPGSRVTNRSSHTPCMTVDHRVFAPASTFAALRTMTPVMGSAATAPHRMLPTPCATSSRSNLVRGPVCLPSTATAHRSVSALAMRANANAACHTRPRVSTSHPGQPIGRSASVRLAETRTRSTPMPPWSSTAGPIRIPSPSNTGRPNSFTSTASSTATTAAGTSARRFGATVFQNVRTRMASRPMIAASLWLALAPSGGSNPFHTACGMVASASSTFFGASSSTISWNCLAKMVRPMPASIPSTTAGETARNHWPSRHAPAAIWISPASTITRPSSATALAPANPALGASSRNWITSTMRPAAGPDTWSGLPASRPTTIPPTMPVTRPASGGRPHACAMPMHSGSATMNTTSDARKSAASVPPARAGGFGSFSALMEPP